MTGTAGTNGFLRRRWTPLALLLPVVVVFGWVGPVPARGFGPPRAIAGFSALAPIGRLGGTKHDGDKEKYDNDDERTPLLLPRPCGRPPTPSDLERFRVERRLLGELLDGDAAIKELRNFWFAERGRAAEARMYEAEVAIGRGPASWENAEELLRGLCAEHPGFVEPFVRLSKLYCLQGRFGDSRQLCEAALAIKPWHYVALETMVALSLVQDHNENLLFWASRRLPGPSRAELRREWVERALEDSLRLEEEASSSAGPERPAGNEWFVKDDDNDNDNDNDNGNNNNEDEAWQ